MRRNISFILIFFLVLLGGYFFRYSKGKNNQQSRYIPKATYQDFHGVSVLKDSTIQTLELLRKRLQPDANIIQNRGYNQLLDAFEQLCPAGTKETGDQLYSAYVSHAVEGLNVYNLPDGARLYLTAEKFITHNSLLKYDSNLSLYEYCMRSYASIKYQQLLSNIHRGFLVDSGIQEELIENTIHPHTEHIKEQLLSYQIHSKGRVSNESVYALQQVGIQFDQSLLDPKFDVNQSFKNLVYLMTYQTLGALIDKEYITKEIGKEIGSKLGFIFEETCDDQLRGAYEFSSSIHYNQSDIERIRSKQNTVYNGIVLTVPLCQSYENLIYFSLYFEHILLHEIGHYMYHNDPHHSKFTSLCRNKNNQILDQCDISMFATEYAMTSPQEDYAESWAGYVHDAIFSRNRYKHMPNTKKGYFQQKQLLNN